MDLHLNGKVALVAAASQGLGYAVATRLAEEGARVIICARNADRLNDARDHIVKATGADIHAIAADLSDRDDVARLAREAIALHGRLDILINNCGGPRPGRTDDLGMADWDNAYRQVMAGTIQLTTACLPAIREARGSIVNLSSYSVKQPIPDLMLSNSFRLGLVGWAKSLALDVAGDRVRVNTVCPGWARTDRVEQMVRSRAAAGSSAADVEQNIVSGIPLGRMATPGDIADVVVFMASDRSGYMTGAVVPVDGGIVQSPL